MGIFSTFKIGKRAFDTLETVKTIMILVMVLIVAWGAWQIASPVFSWIKGPSKEQLKVQVRDLNDRIRQLENEKKLNAQVQESEKKIEEVVVPVVKELKKQVVYTEQRVQVIRTKTDQKLVEIKQNPSLDEEQRFVQGSQVIYDMVMEAVCLADPNQCQESTKS